MAFLCAYVEVGTIDGAARAAKVSQRSHYNWLTNPKYAESFAWSEDRAIQIMETEAKRRAVHGVEEPVIYQGRLQYEPLRDKYGREVKDANGNVVYTNKPLTVRKPSDVLLMFLLKSKRPQIYRENTSVELAAQGGGPLNITVEYVESDGNGGRTKTS